MSVRMISERQALVDSATPNSGDFKPQSRLELIRPATTTFSLTTSRQQSVKMGHAAGLRAGTRYAFSKDFKKKASRPDHHDE